MLSITPASTASPPTAAPASSGHYLRDDLLIAATKKSIDFVRSAAKLPEAYRAGRLPSALAQTAIASPTNRLIDPHAPTVASALSEGRSFTTFDRALYRSSIIIDVGLGVFRLGSGIPNLVHAVHYGGAKAIINTRQGRDGALQTAAGALTLGLFGRAAGAARAAGIRGGGAIALAAMGSETLTAPWVIGTALGSSAFIFANDHGFLDFMNAGNTQSVRQVEHNAWHTLGVRVDQKVQAESAHIATTADSSNVRRIAALVGGLAATP